VDSHYARVLWQHLEPLHAVTYFADDCRAANKALGLRGFWMGYFAARAAPLGPAGPGMVEATFYNFHPTMIRRALPNAWTYTTPDAVLAARSRAAAGVLRRHVTDIAEVAAATLPALRDAVACAPASGRTLFAANRDLPEPVDPVEALWQAATTLREHRGDGHVAVLLAEGISGLDAHVLFAAQHRQPAEVWVENRGFTAEDWHRATVGLAERGLLGADGLTDTGKALREHVETRTDALAAAAYTTTDAAALVAALAAASTAVARSGEIPYPNPMGANPV
jgi:hypothetical protein